MKRRVLWRVLSQGLLKLSYPSQVALPGHHLGYVLGMCCELQVIRVDARSVSALVVGEQALN